ncbi:hypothetical protein BH18ACI5_BH18ACI5_13080 [soil metagenome]
MQTTPSGWARLGYSSPMRPVATLGIIVIAALPLSRSSAQGQGRPDFSGTWSLVPDSPAGTAKPATPPGLGAQVSIRQDGNNFTVSRVMGGSTFNVTHVLDGIATRSRSTGPLCVGDAQMVWTAAWQQDSIETTLVGSIAAGMSAPVTRSVKTVFRLQSPETMSVEVASPAARGGEPGVVTARYRKTGAASPVATVKAVAAGTIAQLEWLSGTWSGTVGAATVEERWTPPAGGSMSSVGRTLRNGAMPAFEFLCIVERNGGLVYTAMPNGRQPATDFTMTKIEGNAVTFENPEHDFPKMIRYSLRPDGMLEAVVSGDTGSKPDVFVYKRQ